MPARVIDGKAVAAEVRARVARQVEEFADAQSGRVPGLATVLVGDDPASQIYIANKRKSTEEVGMRSVHHGLDASITQDELLGLIGELNADDEVDGILVQVPLPEQIAQDAVISSIDPDKDVDGLTAGSAGRLAQGRPGLVSCTPQGVMELLASAGVETRSAEAVVIGRSILVGRPLASLLLNADATVTVCHSRTADLAETCRRADILVAAVGSPRLVRAEWVKPGAAVIDVGMNRTEDGLVGDVDFAAVAEIAGAITPVPGGVGPMTIAMLLANTLWRPETGALEQAGACVDIRPVPRFRGLACGAHERLERAGSGARFTPNRGRKSSTSAECDPETRSHPTRGGSMDFTRLSQGEKIAGIAGIALFIIMFLSWFGAPDNAFTAAANSAGVDTTFNAWQSFDFIDIVLMVTVIAAVGLAVLAMSEAEVGLPVAASAVVAALGALSTVLVLYRILDPPADASRKFGVFLGLIAAAAVAYGGWQAMQEEGTSFSDEAGRVGGGGDAGTGAPPPPATPSNPPPSNPPPSSPPPSNPPPSA